jgi:hypothetical protein
MIIDILILYLYALSSSAPSVEPALQGKTLTQSQHADGQRHSDKTDGKLTSVIWGT